MAGRHTPDTIGAMTKGSLGRWRRAASDPESAAGIAAGGEQAPSHRAGAGRFGRVSLAGVLVGAVLAVAFGTGYSATRALSSDGSAWLRKGDTIVHINGPSRRFDATVADSPVALAAATSDPLEVVEDPAARYSSPTRPPTKCTRSTSPP